MPWSAAHRVLVIEDDGATRANLRDILELDGYEVHSAGSAAEAIRLLNRTDITAIVLDRRLPDASGEELLPQLRERAPEAAIIMVTGYADLEGAIAAVRQGATDYLLKPINVDLLRATLARVAERTRLAAELKEAQRRAMQAERLAAIGEVYTGLAHESRNALQRSQACLERLAKRVQDRPEALNLIARIQKAQDHLHKLYEEVRTYAAPLNSLERQRCHLGQLLEQTWQNLAVERKNREARFGQEAGTCDLHCFVNPARMEQVFRNILENALSATADSVEIRVAWSETSLADQPALRVAIRDNGSGLNDEARQRIFEPFYTTKTHGTGLGMAITKRLVEAHGGQIEVGEHSTPGAEIVITLPRGNP